MGWFCVVLGGGRTGRHAYAHYGNYNQLLSSYCMHLACMLSLQPLDFLQDRIAVCHHDTLQTALHALPAAWNACPGSPSGEFLVIPQVPTSSGKSSLAPKATPGSRFSVPIGPCSRPSWCLLKLQAYRFCVNTCSKRGSLLLCGAQGRTLATAASLSAAPALWQPRSRYLFSE